ncbi:MAG: hypothetical protein R3D85_14410 [Paracoccaceae bacterium]
MHKIEPTTILRKYRLKLWTSTVVLVRHAEKLGQQSSGAFHCHRPGAGQAYCATCCPGRGCLRACS